jgi:hypothetical protein
MKGTAEDIILVLVDVINQSCQVRHEKNKVFCSDMALSSYEDAFQILEIEGYARRFKRGKNKGLYELHWIPRFLKVDNLPKGTDES